MSSGDYPGKMIQMLSIVLDPKDMSCICLTLPFIIQQTRELELQTPGLKPMKLFM